MLVELCQQHASPHRNSASQCLHLFPKEFGLTRRIKTKETSRMEHQPLGGVGCLAPNREGDLGPVHGVEQSEQGDGLSIGLELLSHLECNGSTSAIAAQKIRPVRLHSSYLLQVQGRHLIDFR